jgi:hypothetical protein
VGGREQLDPTDANPEPVYDPDDALALISISKKDLDVEERRVLLMPIFEKNLKALNCPVAVDLVRRYPKELTEKLHETADELQAAFRSEREELSGNAVELKHSRERQRVYEPLLVLDFVKRSQEAEKKAKATV